MLIKIGIRNNLLYPINLILTNLLLDIVQIIIKEYLHYHEGYFICCALIFFSQFLSGLIPLLLFKYQNRKKTKKKNINGFNLIHGKEKIKQADNIYIILILLSFASYFNLIGTIVRRKYFYQKKSNVPKRGYFIEHRFKNIQIEVSALVSYLALKIKIYKHQRVSLIIISIFLILIIQIYQIILNIFYYLLFPTFQDHF